MLCNKCGFITRGIEAKCPYCGSPLGPEKPLDKKINVLGWFDMTIRSLLWILAIDLFVIFMVVDIILFFTAHLNYHLSLYSFLGIFIILGIINDLVFPRSEHKFLFIKGSTYFILSSIIILLSYIGDTNIFNTGLKPYQFVLGYYLPSAIIFLYVAGMLRFIFRRNFNVFINVVYIFSLLFVACLLFGLQFIPIFDYASTTVAQVLLLVSFVMSILFLVNSIIIFIVKITTRSIREA